MLFNFSFIKITSFKRNGFYLEITGIRFSKELKISSIF